MKKVGETLSTIEVAHDLGLGRATVHRWIHDGTIPAIKVGRNYRVPLEPYLKIKTSLVHKEDSTSPQINQLMDEWLHHLANGPRPFSRRTVEDYRYNFLRYLKMLGGGSTLAEVINRESVRQVLERIPVFHYSWRYHLVSSVVSFAKFLAGRKLLPEPQVKELIALRPSRSQPPRKTVLEGDQISQFLDAIWTMNGNSRYERRLNYAISKTFLLTGLRNQELCDLRVSDIDLEKRILTVWHGKGGKFRQLGINQELARILTEYISYRPKSFSAAFFLTEKGSPLVPPLVSRRIKRIAQAAGVNVTTHGLRRTWVTQSAYKGHSLAVISKAAGHNHLSTTQGYLMLSEKQVIAEMQAWQ